MVYLPSLKGPGSKYEKVPSLQDLMAKESLENLPQTQSICVDLLSTGHVRSFVDFFYMVLGPSRKDLPQQQQPFGGFPLEISYTPESLASFRDLLTQVEDSQRNGDLMAVYESRKNIAKYFLSLKNFDVAVTYFKEALDISLKMMSSGTNTSMEMEACLNLGEAYEANGNLKKGLEFYERSHYLAHLKNDTEGEELASKALVHVYMAIAESLEHESKYNEAVGFYSQAIQILEKECDEKRITEIEFRLGKAYNQTGHTSTAIKYLEKFLAASQKDGNRKREGLAQAALAACYEKSGNIQLAASYLQNFVEMTELDPSQRLSEAHACHQLGALYNKLGQYTTAVRFFERHYSLAVELTAENLGKKSGQKSGEARLGTAGSFLKHDELDIPDVGVAAVQLGIAKGNAQMAKFFEHVSDERKLAGLLAWKSTGTFDTESRTLKG